jgi:hypothetical protein
MWVVFNAFVPIECVLRTEKGYAVFTCEMENVAKFIQTFAPAVISAQKIGPITPIFYENKTNLIVRKKDADLDKFMNTYTRLGTPALPQHTKLDQNDDVYVITYANSADALKAHITFMEMKNLGIIPNYVRLDPGLGRIVS